MTLEQMMERLKGLQSRMKAKGYRSARMVAHFNWMQGHEVTIAASCEIDNMRNYAHGPLHDLADLLRQTEAWMEKQPDANQAAKEKFLKMLEELPREAQKLGIELPPVKLAS